MKLHGIEIDTFTMGYLIAALWTDEAGIEEQGGEAELEKLSEKAVKKAVEDCASFQETQVADLSLYYSEYGPKAPYTSQECAGHDFWFTRNHHGVGFWDRGLGDLGKRLTDASHPYGEVSVVVGDDKQLHFE